MTAAAEGPGLSRLSGQALLPGLFPPHEQIQALDLLARPGCAAQELQTGVDTGLRGEAPDRNLTPEFSPAEMVDQGLHHHGQGNAVQGVTRLLF